MYKTEAHTLHPNLQGTSCSLSRGGGQVRIPETGVRPRGDAVESGRGGAVGPCRGRAEGRGQARPRRGRPRGRRRRCSGTGRRCSGTAPRLEPGARGRGAGARGRRRVWSPVLGDGVGAVDGAGVWGLGAPRLRFGAVEWRLRFGARAREKKGK